ncbi:MAG: exonuclease SbcCD subunit D C-terminal domain-containing protein [Bacteroidia bacterium]|nr:exonuclease SbcCD subunit D C-terminal domain-containing protein [Bacteroidia bacterium]
MKILHTSDWHLGQLFYGFDRWAEHNLFLDWLLITLKNEDIDVLLISGDVFDVSNPSAASIKMFYAFLINAVKTCPELQIIVTAGNHDSASRLETPQPLVELMNIHIVGSVKRDAAGNIDFESMVVPLKNRSGEIKAWCIAAPFLRMGDYPHISDCENPYAEGVADFYRQAFAYASAKREPHQAIVAMGHLHTLRAEIGDLHSVEREIMGGIEGILPSAFDDEICYVALGHIHKAQCVGGKEHVRYCGSPLPMSFSELNYKHRVTVFDIEGAKAANIRHCDIPVSVPLRRITGTLDEALDEIATLPSSEKPGDFAPFLEVRVLLESPEPSLKYRIDEALKGKNVRLARIDARVKNSPLNSRETQLNSKEKLKKIQPIDLLHTLYRTKYAQPLPENLTRLFLQVTEEVNQAE